MAGLGSPAALHLDAGTSGIMVGGTTGESTDPGREELLALLERARARLARTRRR